MEFLYTLLIEPLSYEFMRRGLIIASIVAVSCAVLSCFLVLKGWSLMGDAISHAVLPGIVIAYVLSLPLLLGAFFAGLGCALTSGYLKNNSRIKEDAVLGIVFSGMFAIGLVLLTKVQTDIHLLHILFGNMLGASWSDINETLAIAVVTLLAVSLKYKDLVLYCFDPSHAQSIGLPVKVLHFGSLIFLALTIIAALKSAGIILVIAMLIAPGAIAYLLTNRFEKMLIIAVMVSLASCWLGTVISFHLDVATAPLIIVIQACVFLTTLLWAPGTGLLRKAPHVN